MSTCSRLVEATCSHSTAIPSLLTVSRLWEVHISVSQRPPGDHVSADPNGEHRSGWAEFLVQHSLRDVGVQVANIERSHRITPRRCVHIADFRGWTQGFVLKNARKMSVWSLIRIQTALWFKDTLHKQLIGRFENAKPGKSSAIKTCVFWSVSFKKDDNFELSRRPDVCLFLNNILLFFLKVSISLSRSALFKILWILYFLYYFYFKFFRNSELDTHGCFVAGERDCVGGSMGTL